MFSEVTAFRRMWLALVFLFSAPTVASDLYQDPYSVVEHVAEQLFSRLASEQEAIRSQPDQLKQIIAEEVLPSVDYRYAAYKVMGQQARKTERAQRDAFVDEFRDYMVATYAQLFTRYDKDRHSYKLDPRARGRLGNKEFITVRVRILESGQSDVLVDFRLRKNRKSGEWRAYDMVTEGISFLDSKTSELSGLIRQQGIEAVTVQLAEKSRQPIRFE